MKTSLLSMAAAGFSGFLLASVPVQAEGAKLSPERLDALDKRGYFTPAFKAAVHDLVSTKKALADAQADQKNLKEELPDLQKKVDAAEAKLTGLRQELEHYSHPDNADFIVLQAKMKDTTAKLEDQFMLAQAYIWAYPTSSHQAEAQTYLQTLQQKLADQQQAEATAAAASAAARVQLLQRVQSRDLSIAEWRDFLRDMSEIDLLKYLGTPDSKGNGYWTYKGEWTTDPSTGQRVGLVIAFNGTRVNSVALGEPGR